jgi:hypothetical protein
VSGRRKSLVSLPPRWDGAYIMPRETGKYNICRLYFR